MDKKLNRKTLALTEQALTQETLPPLLFPAQTKTDQARLTKLIKQKKIRKIGPRLYTSVLSGDIEVVVRRHWQDIVAHLFPEALLSHRSALEYKPSPNHDIILTSTTNRKIKLPGLTLHFVRGPGVHEDDPAFLGFRVSSQARAYLENLAMTKATAWRALPQVELENKLETLFRAKGEKALNQLRNEARAIAKKFHWQKHFNKLDLMIGALLGTRSAKVLQSATGRARAQGKAYDQTRVARFDLLFSELKATPLREIRDNYKAKDHFNNKAFFEAYFSNYIEGTTFEIEEAEEIVFDQRIPENRPKDAHDILGTFQIVSDPNEMKKTPRTADDLENLIKSRHQIMMAERPEVDPGSYKTRPNRAGDTHFVNPNEITGTFEKAFTRYLDLEPGLARAIYMMFLIAEVHPFTDGNGRIARIMMNAELVSQGMSTIIIPNVYREDYLSSLRALTRRDRPAPLIRMLTRAHQFSTLQFSPYKSILEEITKKNWFREPSEAKLVE